jgi:hypothetical protein
MPCPECGEPLNVIDLDQMECCHCGWQGNVTKWEMDMSDNLKEVTP